MKKSPTSSRYANLKKPSWAPPNWLFGPVWTVLYLIIFASFGVVFYHTYTGEISLLVALPFALNLVFNAIFTPIQFGFKSNIFALIDIVLVWLTLVTLIALIYRVPGYSWVALVNIPYLAWVSFATILQITVTWLNRK